MLYYFYTLLMTFGIQRTYITRAKNLTKKNFTINEFKNRTKIRDEECKNNIIDLVENIIKIQRKNKK